jgi:electron transfer flavoprotein alpha subunit
MSVIVYTENWDGKFKKLSFELVSYASEIARMMGTTVTAVSIGNVSDSELSKLGNFGVSKILKVESDKFSSLDCQVFTGIIANAAETENAGVIVLANNNSGKALAPRLSVRLKAALASGVSKLPVSTEPFIINKKVFSGKAFANINLKTTIKILTLAPNSTELAETKNVATIEPFTPPTGDFNTIVKDVQKQTGKILLNDADIVVSGGRGLKSPDNWGPIEELAGLLGAATACSRPVSDEGWRPHGEHTGQTGKIIAPNLYIAAGISGAIQHLAGVSSSKCIVAINTDKDAPIFEAADYGVVGDAMKVLPDFIKAVKEAKAK